MKLVNNEEQLIAKKYIYKVTNKLNNKVYIGQTKDYIRRFREHKKMYHKEDNSILHRAIQKYGEDNFDFEVIDYGTNYNELEKFYIEYFDSINNGYNISHGGENPPFGQGENSSHAKHTQEEIDRLKYDLINTNKSFNELSIEYNYKSDCSVRRINNGKIWNNKNEKYPLRDITSDNIIDNIIYLLRNTKLTQKEIAKQLGIKRSTVTMTNIGVNNNRPNEIYLIRDTTKKMIKRSEEFYNELIEYIILNPEEKITSISKKFNISLDMVYRINKGEYYKNSKYNYPLNKNNNII